MSIVSAFTTYSTMPDWHNEHLLTEVDDEYPECPDYAVAFWLTHREAPQLGPRWYIFCSDHCPEDNNTRLLYPEFDDWEYIPNTNWEGPNPPVWIPASLQARDDPLLFLSIGIDPNGWVEDLIDAVHMTIGPQKWDSDDSDTPPFQRSRWGQPNRHQRRRMGNQALRNYWVEQDQYTYSWTITTDTTEWGAPEWETHPDQATDSFWM